MNTMCDLRPNRNFAMVVVNVNPGSLSAAVTVETALGHRLYAEVSDLWLSLREGVNAVCCDRC